jgi:CelD/BcsL family acetyltransferase involved in cellulose biosynthesis
MNNKNTYNIQVIKKWDEIEELKESWHLVLSNSGADNLFLTWEWMNCWRKSRQQNTQPLILIVENKDGPLAIAPFYIQKYRLLGVITYRALRFIGDKNSGSEYSDFIVSIKDNDEIKSLIWQYLLSNDVKSLWDFIWFTNVSTWTTDGESFFQSLMSTKKLNYNQRAVEFGQVPLNKLTQDFLPLLSKSLRTNIRQTMRRLDKLGAWEVKTNIDTSNLNFLLENLFLLHNKHWESAGLGSFERSPELTSFYNYFVPVALDKGWLRLYRIEIDGEIQAIQLGYVYNNIFMAIQEGYNPDFLAGTGQVLRYYSYQKCIEEGIKVYDFLGVYTDHKRRWLADKKIGSNFFIWNNKFKNLPFYFKKIWPTGRFLKPY